MHRFFSLIWRLLPQSGLASDYHPCTQGGVIPIPFVQTQKRLQERPPHPELYSPRLDAPRTAFRTYLSGYCRLPLRDRALVTLRSAHLSGAHHLLANLALTALDHGLQPSDIQLIKTGYLAEGWNKRETLLIQAVDDLHHQQKISHKLWQTLSRVYDPGQILDFTLCSGAFHLCQHPEA